MSSTHSPAESPPDAGGRRAELLAIAGRLFARSGYTGTSLRDVADAAGILPGSMYHHFASKQMLAVELVHAFHAELERLARTSTLPSDPIEAIREFARRAAELADAHGAAVILGMYDAPSAAGETLAAIVRRRPEAYDTRWRELLDVAAERGRLRPGTDLGLLRLVLRDPVVELGRLPGVQSSGAVVRSLTDLVLDGLVRDAPPEAELDRAAAMTVAVKVAASWSGPPEEARPRRRQILDAARHEFARRGYESTTVRDIAEAAGMRASSLYRHFDSKQAMLSAIIGSYSHVLLAGFEQTVAASSTATEGLDALTRLMCSATEHFRPEFAIISSWWRTRDPESPDPAMEENTARLDLLTAVVRQGVESGEFVAPAHPDELPIALRDLLWTPPVQDVTPSVEADERFRFLRACLLHGVAVR